MRFVVISDTHSEEMDDVPDGVRPALVVRGEGRRAEQCLRLSQDVLLHSGDLTKLGSDAEVRKQIDWLVCVRHG